LYIYVVVVVVVDTILIQILYDLLLWRKMEWGDDKEYLFVPIFAFQLRRMCLVSLSLCLFVVLKKTKTYTTLLSQQQQQ
jgi:hypothetical protein